MGLGVDGSGDSEDMSNYIVSDCEDLNYTAGSMSERTKKGLGKLKSMKGNEKDKKKEFIGWGSRSLMEFLEYIGEDTSNEFSEHDVTSIIIEYCRENDLFDPKKKRKIHCDAPLRSLLGRKSVNRNSMQNLLAQHFAENFEEMGDISSSSEDRDYNEPSTFSRKRKSISCTKSHNLNLVCEEHQSCFAAIVSSNLKLVYLKRSLVDELSKQPQTFDDKVLGSYVRIKTDPYDYLQKNSHLLVQVVGINISLRNDEFNKEIMLQLSYVPKHVPISKISDDDFSEEECQDLYQRMRNGLLKQPTVLELEQKARSLHEDIMKHWISRKLVLLQNRIDHANEKGWRRELAEYIDQKLKLETQLEQSRLLNDIPKVIPEIDDTTLSQEGSPRIDKVEQNGLSELASGQTSNSVGHYSKHSGFAHSLNNRTDVAGKMVRSRGRDDSIIRHGHVQHGVSTSLHGHLAIELGNIPYSNVQPGTTAFVDDHQSVPHSSAPSSSNHTSVPRTVGGENVVQCPTYGHSWGLAVQPIVAPSVHTVLAPSVHTNPAPQVQTTSAPPVEPIHDASKVHDLPDEKVQRDANGRVIIRPVGKGWTPNHHAIEAIGHAIRSQFRGPYHHYEAMSEEAKLRWWTEFKTRVTWAPHDEWQIIKVYESKVRKRLCDMLSKARVKGSRPTWIGEEAWGELLNYWDSQKFKDKSSQNKINRSSVRGGALHSSGRKSHLDIALGLERKYGRPVEPDELFLATHTNKKGDWIDGRSRETYETYHEQLRMMQSKSSKGSISDVPPIDAATKLQCWKDVAGGKSRGRVYGTADLAANFRHGALSLTQPSVLASTIDRDEQFAQNSQLRHQILEATERANQANQRTAELKETVRLMQQQLAMMMERYVADTPIDTSEVHPHRRL
ncbi:uncharacterized protein [Phaseolus vulgaris]